MLKQTSFRAILSIYPYHILDNQRILQLLFQFSIVLFCRDHFQAGDRLLRFFYSTQTWIYIQVSIILFWQYFRKF